MASRGTLPVKKGKWETICTPARCFIASQAQMAPSYGLAQPGGRAATRTATPGLRTARACPRCEPERGSGRQLPTAPLRPAEGRKTSQGPLMTAFVPRWLRPESPRAQPALPAAVSPADRVTPSPSFRMAASSLGGNPITFWWNIASYEEGSANLKQFVAIRGPPARRRVERHAHFSDVSHRRVILK